MSVLACLLPTHASSALGRMWAAQLNGAVLMGHSQSGSFLWKRPCSTPLAPKGSFWLRAGPVPSEGTLPEQVETLATIPLRRCSSATIGTTSDGHLDAPLGRLAMTARQELIGRLKDGRRSGADAQLHRIAESGATARYDHAGQEQPADCRFDPAVDRPARQQAKRGKK